MRIKVIFAVICCLAAVALVQSEPIIEVDENGDEYEVKRFNIEGRNLNEGRSQCVVTRRKRSTPNHVSGVVAVAVANQASNTNRNGENFASTSASTPSSNVDTNTGDDYDNEDTAGGDIQPNGGNVDENENLDNIIGDNGDNDDFDYENAVDQDNVQLPIIVQEQGIAVQAVKPAEEVVAIAAADNSNPNGIVVVESSQPPQVDPDTHAVFQLLPVNHAIHSGIDEDADDGSLHFEEEISPVSTTAIWSTGDDDSSLLDLYDDDYDTENPIDELEKPKPGSGNKKPGKKPNKKPVKKPKKKSKKKPGNNGGYRPQRRPNNGGNKNKRPNKRRPQMGTGNRKPIQKRRRPGQKNQRPLTGNRRKGNYSNRDHQATASQRRRHPSRGSNSNRSSDRYTNNRKSHNRRRHNSSSQASKRRRKSENKKKNEGTYTKTETVTQTGTANDEKDVNCIIIRKDPPSTTARPFWNILGREAGDVSQTGQFGKRKRANLRFSTKN